MFKPRTILASLTAAFLLFSASSTLNSIFAFYTNMPASVVVGQPDFVSGSVNQGGSANERTLRVPKQMAVCEGKLVVADSNNNRVLIYNSVPSTNNVPADVVIGQPDFSATSPNQGGSANQNTLSNPSGVGCAGNTLLIGDTNNHRVLIYNVLPKTNNASADVVIGQQDFTSNLPNQGGSCNANTLKTTGDMGLSIYDKRLFVADRDNSRLLIFNSIPASNNASADVVVGQPDFLSCNGQISANKLHLPRSVASDGRRLFVSEQTGDRILVFSSIPNVNGASADVVIGQEDFTSEQANQGGSVSANTLSSPKGIGVYDGRLFVADQNNMRVLIWNEIPTQHNGSADIVLGQMDFTSNKPNQGGSASSNTLSSPQYVLLHEGKLLVSDFSNNRILIFESAVDDPIISLNTPPIRIDLAPLQGGIIDRSDIVSIVPPGTFKWVAYLSIQETAKKGAFRLPGTQYWQSSDIFEYWWKAYYNDARILADEVQKPFIISLSYNPLTLEPTLPEKNLKLAYSSNEGKTWRILSRSVLDQENNTVATVTKEGGWYMLVSGYPFAQSTFSSASPSLVAKAPTNPEPSATATPKPTSTPSARPETTKVEETSSAPSCTRFLFWCV